MIIWSVIQLGEDMVVLFASDNNGLLKDEVPLIGTEPILIKVLTLFPDHDHGVDQHDFLLSHVRVDSVLTIGTDDIVLIQRVIVSEWMRVWTGLGGDIEVLLSDILTAEHLAWERVFGVVLRVIHLILLYSHQTAVRIFTFDNRKQFDVILRLHQHPFLRHIFLPKPNLIIINFSSLNRLHGRWMSQLSRGCSLLPIVFLTLIENLLMLWWLVSTYQFIAGVRPLDWLFEGLAARGQLASLWVVKETLGWEDLLFRVELFECVLMGEHEIALIVGKRIISRR